MQPRDVLWTVDDECPRVLRLVEAEFGAPEIAVALMEDAVEGAMVAERSVLVDLHEIDAAAARQVDERATDEAGPLLFRQRVAYTDPPPRVRHEEDSSSIPRNLRGKRVSAIRDSSSIRLKNSILQGKDHREGIENLGLSRWENQEDRRIELRAVSRNLYFIKAGKVGALAGEVTAASRECPRRPDSRAFLVR